MNIGVIGVGVMGKNHVRIYSELRDVDEVYVYDIDKTALREVSERYGAIACDSMDLLLKKVDAVSVCVPTKYHFEVAKRVIENDVSCLIEKPVTSTSEDGGELLKIAKNRDYLTIGVGHVERFNPVVKEIKKIVNSEVKAKIFVFGSILSNEYSIGLSDIDIAIVSNEFINKEIKMRVLSMLLDKYFDSPFEFHVLTEEQWKFYLIFIQQYKEI